MGSTRSISSSVGGLDCLAKVNGWSRDDHTRGTRITVPGLGYSSRLTFQVSDSLEFTRRLRLLIGEAIHE